MKTTEKNNVNHINKQSAANKNSFSGNEKKENNPPALKVTPPILVKNTEANERISN